MGFVTSNQHNNCLISNVLQKDDVFILPIGLIHFQVSIGHGNSVTIAGLRSQNLGVITMANSVFGSNLPISEKILIQDFQVDKKVMHYLQAQFWRTPATLRGMIFALEYR